jgi:ABC-type uncharacterized transport system auxiliary subunit
MKKFFAIAFIAAATLVACNNESEKKDTPDTAAVPPVDTTKSAPVDTSKMAGDTTKMATPDTTKK